MRSTVRRVLPPLLVVALSAGFVLLPPAPLPAQSTPGTGWRPNGSALPDFDISIDSSVARTGRASIRIAASVEPDGFAGAMTLLPAARFAGKAVRLTAWLRAEALGAPGATVWLRADSGEATRLLVSSTGKRVITGDLPWTAVSLDMDVPPGATEIALGVYSQGRGRIWFDDVVIVPATDAGNAGIHLGFESPDTLAVARREADAGRRSPREPARPLTRQGVENVVAFARLAAYVRFWYPGDSALRVNWDEFTIRGMRAVERAPTPDSLAATMRALFAPFAPELTIATRKPAATAASVEVPHGVLYWQHCGFGVPESGRRSPYPNVYKSVRVHVPARDGKVPASVPAAMCRREYQSPVPDPARPFVVNLGAGVWASVPLALAASDSERALTWQPRQSTETFSVRDRATRLGIVALLWMVPQHFYPYFDVVHPDWNGALRRALSDAAAGDNRESFDSTLQRLTAALRDGHGNVWGQSGVGSAGVRLGWVENQMVVLAANEVAKGHGLAIGDVVTAVDGVPAAERLRQAEQLVSGATPQWIRATALQRLTMGPITNVLTLQVRGAAAGTERTVQLARVASPPPDEPRPPKIAELRPGIFYVDFSRVSDSDMVAAMPTLATAKGVVFDMRGYPRQMNTAAVLAHLSADTIRSARFQVPLVTRPDHEAMQFEGEGWIIAPRAPKIFGRVAFLTGGGAISYAESTMGVVEENHLGAIVGETTAGTNGNVNPFLLPAGYSFTWTGMRVQKRDGTPHHGVGIKPTIEVKPTLKGIRSGRDEVLDRALNVVAGTERDQ